MGRLERWIEEELAVWRESKPAEWLRRSISDQIFVDTVRRLRRLIRRSDPAEKISARINDEEFMRQMHRDIMTQVLTAQNSKAVLRDPVSVASLATNFSPKSYNN